MSIKVLLVDDSLFMRRLISDIVNRDPDLELVGQARNGKEAIELNKELKPDVILLDVEMPVVDGIEALEVIMRERKCAVIMFSSTTSKGAENTIKALELGACDFIPKPVSSTFKLDDEVIEEILAKLKYSRCIEPNGRKRVPARPILSRPTSFDRASERPGKSKFKKLVAIGISTGGPRALEEVLAELPADLNAPIVVVQHMPKLFTSAFAGRLNASCAMAVKEAEDGEVLKTGTVYIAPGDRHLRIKKVLGELKVSLEDGEKVTGHKPSVDAMYYSLLEISDLDIIAVIMTGMGRDGADGMLKLKKKGARTIAQDQATCVVYGMPKSACDLGAVDKECSLDKIAEEIINSVEV